MDQDSNAMAGTTRFSRGDFAAIENWRRAQPKIPPFAEALRVLVRAGLAASEPTSNRRRERRPATWSDRNGARVPPGRRSVSDDE